MTLGFGRRRLWKRCHHLILALTLRREEPRLRYAKKRLLSTLALLIVWLASAWTGRVAAQNADANVALAEQIKIARANAKPGDIFTPETQRVFERLVSSTFKSDEGVENKTVLKEDRPPAAKIPLQVNGEYPKGQPLSTVPPDLLRTLPPLPEAVQYRFAGKHLILYCTRGNLIVDYMLNAIP
jgi:hypothetical protein